jgi:hypothetical protein
VKKVMVENSRGMPDTEVDAAPDSTLIPTCLKL